MSRNDAAATLQRQRLTLRGSVQGVGFRPFVYRLARSLDLTGWVQNTSDGLVIEVEGNHGALEDFIERLNAEKPVPATVESLAVLNLSPCETPGFKILESSIGNGSTRIQPDIATCSDCIHELFSPENRRFRHPFITCTACGPRYTIIHGMPYDRTRTSMSRFAMCARCSEEFNDSSDRRFHAQPICCHDCGPQLSLWNSAGALIAKREDALRSTVQQLRDGKIIALKGIGGFQLLALARNADAIRQFRKRKKREEKPFAVMFPTIEGVRTECDMSSVEQQVLESSQSPILLLSRARKSLLPEIIAPDCSLIGAMLPYSPLHHLILRDLGEPVVATSGNISDEPICIENEEAIQRLRGIGDFFLVHDRPILRRVDDSVMRVMGGRPAVLRSARGCSPAQIPLRRPLPDLTALGAHQKNTVAVTRGATAIISQHIGDLDTLEAIRNFESVRRDLQNLYGCKSGRVLSDLHPDYAQNQQNKGGSCVTGIQHHHAHVLGCMAENEIGPPVLGVAWDGTGLGLDNSIWGGEFFAVSDESITRVAHLRQFSLPGGDVVSREPRRSALGVLHEIFGSDLPQHSKRVARLFNPEELLILQRAMERKLNAPRTSSAGRLFDAVAALTGLRARCAYEGQAVMQLEGLASESRTETAYDLTIRELNDAWIIDWQPMLESILDDLANDMAPETIAARFHHALARVIVSVASRIAIKRVVLTGGCFQNKYLLERTIQGLRSAGFTPFWHQQVPPNDGGISLGQIAAFARLKGS